MKRILTLICTLALMAVSFSASAKGPDDISDLEQYATISYFQGKAPMLNKLNLYNYGIRSDLTRKLKALQIAVVPNQKSDAARTIVRKLVDNWDRGLTMHTSSANIVVWGSPDKNGIYNKVVIGIGSPGRLTYIYMEGELNGEDLSLILQPFQE